MLIPLSFLQEGHHLQNHLSDEMSRVMRPFLHPSSRQLVQAGMGMQGSAQTPS